jgi:formylglycine-generating enzyme required for sulfatase activity
MDTLDLREIDLYRILYQIAFKAHNEQEGRAGAADIPETVVQDTVMMALDCDQEQAKTFCDYVEEQAGLLIGRGQARSRWRVFSFPHRTFQEFLAGCYAANNEFSEQVPELIEKGEKWRVALLLATGHLVFNAGNNPEVVNAIDNLLEAHAEQPDWQKVWLAGDMLALIGEQRARTTRRGEKVIKATIDSLVNLIEGSHLTSVERAAAGRTLSVLGDPRPGVRLRGDGLPEIIWADEISAGTYWIGADDQVDNPRRQIIIAQPFRVAKYLVTQAQYLAFQNDMGKRGYACTDWWAGLAADDDDKQPAEPYFSYANHPMENVNWYQAVAFSRWLTWHYQQAGLITPYEEIRLPCEHEWEVAARGIEECTYGYPGDFDTMKCNVRDTGIGQTSAVGLLPNGESPCRALDMTGNVWEWCLNQYADGSTDIMGTFVRVLRGGSFLSARSYVHTAFRYLSSHPLNRIDYDGFRLVHLVV